jgi:hypothetical protein
MKHFQDRILPKFSRKREQKAYFREHDDNVAIFAERVMRIFASFSGLELQGPVGVRPVVHGGKVRHSVRVLALPVTVEYTV